MSYTEMRLLFTNTRTSNVFAHDICMLKKEQMIIRKDRTKMYRLTDVGRNALDLAVQMANIRKKIEDLVDGDPDDIPACLKVLPLQELKQ